MKRTLAAILGLLVGGACLWVVFARVDMHVVAGTLVGADIRWLLASVAIFWVTLHMRILRWRKQLAPTAPLSLRQVAEALIVGYAVNYILPARLGEAGRAEYLQRRFHVDRFSAFGSIVTERTLDGAATVVMLGIGFAFSSFAVGVDETSALMTAASLGSLVFAGIAAIIYAIRHVDWDQLPGPAWLTGPLGRMAGGAAVPDRRSLLRLLGFTIVIWALESATLWTLLLSLSVSLSVPQLLVFVGAGALSVLIPTAPAYVGSLQLAFALVLSFHALPAAAGVAAATLVQVLLYGSVALVAAVLSVYRLVRSRSPASS